MKRYKIFKEGKIIESQIPGRFAGIKTMKIFGRLDCKSGMRAKKENRIFFHDWNDAIAAGYRPCRLCKPQPNDEYGSE
jgi:methylphosphotriester-DNA--protein-cysteine methyltransferase